jgi:Ca2+-transporting ATPase
MKLKPAHPRTSLLTREMKIIIILIGLITDFLLLGLFYWLFKEMHDTTHIRTMIFAALSVDSLFYAFSCKSLRRNLWHINPFSNKLLVIAFVVGLIMLFSAIYLPVFQVLLKTVALNLSDWLIIIGLGLIELILIEATKWYFITRHQTEI